MAERRLSDTEERLDRCRAEMKVGVAPRAALCRSVALDTDGPFCARLPRRVCWTA